MSEERDLAEIVRTAIGNQYRAVLAMLRDAVERCPDEAWAAEGQGVPFWRVAYHTLYFTHLYLSTDERSFTAWEKHQTGLQDLDDIPGPPELVELLEPPHRPSRTGEPLTREEILEYLAFCEGMVDPSIDSLDLMREDTGFSWHNPQRSKIEHQIVNIRHIQYHVAQLSARLRAAGVEGVEWVGSRPPEQADL
ncbi:MAG: hypothetical protein C0418_03525 [Coriobacteriaceae bacterium]|nr:hypothetical protein [Coriobacteriaceae bacterium]